MPLSQDREISGLDRIVVSEAVSGDVIAADAKYSYRVLCYTVLSAGAGTFKFQSGASTDLTGAMPIPANGGVSTTLNTLGHFQTLAGEKLNVVLTGSATVQGHMTVEKIKYYDR